MGIKNTSLNMQAQDLSNLKSEDKNMNKIQAYKITVFGDSVSKGLYFKDEKIKKIDKNVVERMEEHFNIKIDNRSSFGQSLKRLCEKNMIDNYLSQINPAENNMVVLAIGGNDADYNWKLVEGDSRTEKGANTDLDEFERLLTQVIMKLKAKNVLVIVCSLFPINASRYYNEVLSKRYDGTKIMEFLRNDITNLSRNQEAFNAQMMLTAISNDCKFIDFRTDVLQKTDYLNYLCEDGIHPNERGHELMFDIIADCV